jgi:hypothetical protein
MKTKQLISALFATMLVMAFSFSASNSYAQDMKDSSMTKSCCMKKGEKMKCMKDGKMTCSKECKAKCMKDGKMTCMNGKMSCMKDCKMMGKGNKMSGCMGMDKMKTTDKNDKNKSGAVAYTCPMHPDVKSDKPGSCPKCGMDLEKAK